MKLLRRATVVLVATVMGVTGLAAPASAGNAPGDERGVPVTVVAGGIASFLPAPFSAGDCTEHGSTDLQHDPNISRIVLSTPDGNGNATAFWHGFTRTRQTHSGDVWWPSFTFKTAFGTTVLSVPGGGPMRSVTMWTTPEGSYYLTDVSVGVRLDPALYAAIAQVDWHADC
jgi:hypothetical protein